MILADGLTSASSCICFFCLWVPLTCWSYVISLARRDDCPFCCFVADLWWCRIWLNHATISVLTKECSIECTQNQEVFRQDHGCVLREIHVICRLTLMQDSPKLYSIVLQGFHHWLVGWFSWDAATISSPLISPQGRALEWPLKRGARLLISVMSFRIQKLRAFIFCTWWKPMWIWPSVAKIFEVKWVYVQNKWVDCNWDEYGC